MQLSSSLQRPGMCKSHYLLIGFVLLAPPHHFETAFSFSQASQKLASWAVVSRTSYVSELPFK